MRVRRPGPNGLPSSAKLDPVSSSERWARLGDTDGRKWRQVVASAAEQKDMTAVSGHLGSTAANDDDQHAAWLSAFEVDPDGDLFRSEPTMLESSPEAEAPEWIEPVACEIAESLADVRATSACRVSALASGHERERAASTTAPEAPEMDALPVASGVTAKPAEATTVPAASLPWPVFSAPDPVIETATEVVQGATVPWPVFAPAGPSDELAGTAAVTTSRPSEASDLSGLSAPRAVTSASGVMVDGQPDRQTGTVASNPAGNLRDQPAAGAQPVWADAVRLTSQAVNAWVDLLTRPTRVQVTAR